MWHHFWQYRTRWQAWDYPQRGTTRFIDLHAEEINGGLLLPLHLGWWSFQPFNPPQIEPTYPDVMENLGARLIGWDAGISLTAGVDRATLRKTPLFQRAAGILRDLRGTAPRERCSMSPPKRNCASRQRIRALPRMPQARSGSGACNHTHRPWPSPSRGRFRGR